MEDSNKVMEHKTWWTSRKYFFRQLFISSGAWICYFITGLSFGASTVFIPQIRAEANSTEAVTEEVASWIPTIMVYSGLPWSCILPISMNILGRKYTFAIVSICNLFSFIILYFSKTVTHIIISEFINGINTGAQFTVTVTIIAEYTSPKHRGFFLTAKSATLFWGILVANAVGTYFHWKNIALIGIACCIYCFVLSFILPESPYWFISKHRVEKCSKVHRWLKGADMQSERELEQLIDFQKQADKNSIVTNFTLNDYLKSQVKIIFKKQFYKPLVLCILVQFLYVFSGKVVFSVYAIDIIRNITKDQEISAYTAMLILDGVTVSFMYIGCGFAKIFARKMLLIVTSVVGISFLISISIYTYMIKLNIVEENNYVTIALMIGYSIGIACGPIILTQALCGELITIECRGLLSCCVDLFLKISLGTLVKVSPYLFKSWGTEGAFLFYGLTSLLFLLLICKYLPETKDKTLQEISELMRGSDMKPVSKDEILFLAHNKKADNN